MARYSWLADTGALARQGSAGMSTLRPGADRRVIPAQRARQAVVPRRKAQPVQHTHQQGLLGEQLCPLRCRAVVEHPRAGEHDGAGPDDLPRSPGEFVELGAGERRAVAGEGDGLLVMDVRVEDDFQLADGSGRVVPVDLPPTATGPRGKAAQALPGNRESVDEDRVLPLEFRVRVGKRGIPLQQSRVDDHLLGPVVIVYRTL